MAAKLSVRASKSKLLPDVSVGGATVGASTSLRVTLSPVRDCTPATGATNPSSVFATRTGLSVVFVAVGAGPPLVVIGSMSNTSPVTSSTNGRK